MIRPREFDRYNRYLNELQVILNKLDAWEERLDNEVKELSNVDKEIGDYLHIIEGDNEIKNPKTFLNKMRLARRRRREIKVITGVLHRYRQLTNRLGNKDSRAILLTELRKEVKAQLKDYNFRIVEGEENEGVYKPAYDKQTK